MRGETGLTGTRSGPRDRFCDGRGPEGGERMIHEEIWEPTDVNRWTMERYAGDYLRTGDRSLGRALVDADVILHIGGERFDGVETYLDVTTSLHSSFTGMTWLAQEIVVDRRWVAVRYIINGVHSGVFDGVAATGRYVAAQSMSLYRLAGGLIVEEIAQPDRWSIHAQIGHP